MENHAWILAVIDDLESYARQNSLPQLVGLLDRTRKLAEFEISGLNNDDRRPNRLNEINRYLH